MNEGNLQHLSLLDSDNRTITRTEGKGNYLLEQFYQEQKQTEIHNLRQFPTFSGDGCCAQNDQSVDSDQILQAYRQLRKQDDNSANKGQFGSRNDQLDQAKFPEDVIAQKKGVHFTDDFTCIVRLPGVRSTAQNYILECKVTKKRYFCQTLPLSSKNKQLYMVN